MQAEHLFVCSGPPQPDNDNSDDDEDDNIFNDDDDEDDNEVAAGHKVLDQCTDHLPEYLSISLSHAVRHCYSYSQ